MGELYGMQIISVKVLYIKCTHIQTEIKILYMRKVFSKTLRKEDG